METNLLNEYTDQPKKRPEPREESQNTAASPARGPDLPRAKNRASGLFEGELRCVVMV